MGRPNTDPFGADWLDVATSEFARIGAEGLPATVGITVLGGPDGDSTVVWQFADGLVRVVADPDPQDVDVSLNIQRKDARAVLSGDLAPAVAYMQGRLKGSGDMALLLRLMALGSGPMFDLWRERVAAA